MEYNVTCLHPLWIRNPKWYDLVMTMDYVCYNGRTVSITPIHRRRVFDGDSFYKVFGFYYKSDPDKEFRSNSYFLHDSGMMVDFFIPVKCGKCDACKSNKLFSLRQRARFACEECDTDVLFLTLTYNDKHVPFDFFPSKRHLQLFKKRLSELCRSRYGVHLKYFAFSEIGKKGRPHYHLLVYNFPNFRELGDLEAPFKSLHISYCWRDNERVGRHLLSFPEFVKRDYQLYEISESKKKRPIDLRSFGFHTLKIVNSSQASSYVSKYVSKHATDKRLFKLVSVNLGLEFARKHLEFAKHSVDRSFQYVSKVDGQLTTAQLSSYYIQKLLPSLSVLFPRVVRYSIVDTIFVCRHILFAPYGRFSKDLVHRAYDVISDVRSTFPDYEIKDIETNYLYKSKIHEFPYYLSESRCKSLVRNFVAVLNAYKDLKVDLSFDASRSAYFSNMVNPPEHYATIIAQKFRRERSRLISSARL